MRLDGIGELNDLHTHWRLIYDRCEHTQEFAQLGLVDVGRAAAEVRRHYAECLVCRAAKRKLTWREHPLDRATSVPRDGEPRGVPLVHTVPIRAAMTFLDQIVFSTTAIALLVLAAVVVWAGLSVLPIFLSLTVH